jgi:hypothetical protein
MEVPTHTVKVNDGLCINCDAKTVVNKRRGCTECYNCGAINEKLIEINVETVQFNGEDATHFSTSGIIDTLLPRSSMGSYFVGKGYDSVRRLHNWGRVPTKERSLGLVFEKIKRALNTLSVDYTAILNDAKIIYYQLYSRDPTEYTKKNVISRGKIRDGLIAYIVLLSAQNNGIVLQKEVLYQMFEIDGAVFKSGKKKYNTLLLKQTQTNNNETGILQYFTRFLSCIPLVAEEYTICMVICHRIIALNILAHKHPVSSSAGILYFLGLTFPKLSVLLSKDTVINLTEKSFPIISKIVTIIQANSLYIIPLEFKASTLE